MQVFVTGANGFIGGAVAAALIAAGHKVRGLVRNKAKAGTVAAHDVQAVVGSLDDAALLQAEARAAAMRPAAIIVGRMSASDTLRRFAAAHHWCESRYSAGWYQPRQNASSQVLLSRVAEMIKPTIE